MTALHALNHNIFLDMDTFILLLYLFFAFRDPLGRVARPYLLREGFYPKTPSQI